MHWTHKDKSAIWIEFEFNIFCWVGRAERFLSRFVWCLIFALLHSTFLAGQKIARNLYATLLFIAFNCRDFPHISCTFTHFLHHKKLQKIRALCPHGLFSRRRLCFALLPLVQEICLQKKHNFLHFYPTIFSFLPYVWWPLQQVRLDMGSESITGFMDGAEYVGGCAGVDLAVMNE